MYALANAISDADTVLALEPEELAAKLLFLIREGNGLQPMGIFNPGNLASEATNSQMPSGSVSSYANKAPEVELAITEAFAWLEAQGLIVPASGINGANGFRRLSRRARRFESATEFMQYGAARLLRREALHPRISEKVWLAFMRGEYDVAVFQAMKAVEVAVREAAKLSDRDIGVKLMRAAFSPKAGPLTDPSMEEGEQVARMELFAGTIGSFKNPHSHRDVPLDNAAEATEVILLANHLLRIIESRCR